MPNVSRPEDSGVAFVATFNAQLKATDMVFLLPPDMPTHTFDMNPVGLALSESLDSLYVSGTLEVLNLDTWALPRKSMQSKTYPFLYDTKIFVAKVRLVGNTG